MQHHRPLNPPRRMKLRALASALCKQSNRAREFLQSFLTWMAPLTLPEQFTKLISSLIRRPGPSGGPCPGSRGETKLAGILLAIYNVGIVANLGTLLAFVGRGTWGSSLRVADRTFGEVKVRFEDAVKGTLGVEDICVAEWDSIEVKDLYQTEV